MAIELKESAGVAFQALRANKLRSLLTLLGTIIGVTAVIAVISLVQGMNHYVSDRLLARVERGGRVKHEAGCECQDQDRQSVHNPPRRACIISL